MLLRAGWGSMRSAGFLAVFVAIYQSAVESVSIFYRNGLRVNWR